MKIAKLIRDLIISILVIICIVIVLCVIFYEDISLTKVIPESEEILLSKEIQKEVEDTNFEDLKEVVINYYLDASDLKKYEKTNEYNKGKQFPFSDDQTHNFENSINGSGNFFEDDGTK